MFAPGVICSRCASHLRRAVSSLHNPGAAAWHSSIVDASSKSASSESAVQNRRNHLQDDANHGIRRRPHRSPSLAYSSTEYPRLTTHHHSSAVALFRDVVQRSENGKLSAGTVPTIPSSNMPQTTIVAALGEWEIAAKLKEISEKPLSPQERLRIFRLEVWPHVKELRGRLPRHIYVSTIQFLVDQCDVVADEGTPGLSVTLSRMCATMSKWDLDVRNQLVLNLCHMLISRKHSLADRNSLVEELVNLWQHLSQLKRPSQAKQREPRFVLPSVDEIIDDMRTPYKKQKSEHTKSSMTPFTKALSSIFIQMRIEQASQLVPGLLATMAVLSDPRLARQGSQVKMAPLLELIAVALEVKPADVSEVNRLFAGKNRFPASKLSEVHAYVAAQWPQAVNMVLNKDSAWRQRQSLSHQPSNRTSSPAPGLHALHRQLQAAYRSRHHGAVLSTWQDLKARLAQSPDLADQMRQDPKFLDYWVFVWGAIRRPDKLQEVLDVMQQIQVQPTVRTYTSMMHGWKTCKDVDRIEALWHKLAASGMKFDTVIWTERVSGLIEAGKPQAGIEALAEMQRTWKEALKSRGSPESAAVVAVQPTIEVVNAAFKGLAALDRKGANEVLAWAGKEGIEPNIRTFNILLREACRSSESPEDVQSLLKTMKKQGIKPDAATFTILLEELLGTMETASAAEQVQAVEQILGDIEAAGLQANLETYGKMLYAVSCLANGGADEAVTAVQHHMRAAGFSATPHMVTILIERTLSRNSPSLDISASIRAILQQHGLTSVNQGDQTLWERVVSAYAVSGDLPSAMSIFHQLSQAGRPVTSLPCLTDLLSMLLAGGADQAVQAKEVVHISLSHKLKRAADEGKFLDRDNRYWKHHFWCLAKEHNLVNWAEVPADLKSRLYS